MRLGSVLGGGSLQFEVQNFTEIREHGLEQGTQGNDSPCSHQSCTRKTTRNWVWVCTAHLYCWLDDLGGVWVCADTLSTSACQGLGERWNICMEQDGAWGFNLKDRTPLLETKDHGLEQEPRRVTALPPPELPTPLSAK